MLAVDEHAAAEPVRELERATASCDGWADHRSEGSACSATGSPTPCSSSTCMRDRPRRAPAPARRDGGGPGRAVPGTHRGHRPQLARHYSEAGDDLQALRYLTLAADSALASYASDEAERSYRRAMELAQESAQRARCSRAWAGAGPPEPRHGSAPGLAEAIELSQAVGDLEGMARLYARSSDAAWWGGDRPLGLRLCEEGLAATAGAPESAGRARLLHEAARAYYFSGSPERAPTLCQQALAMVERSATLDVQADALAPLGGLPGRAPQEALELLARAAQLAENAKLPVVAFRAHDNLAVLKGMV